MMNRMATRRHYVVRHAATRYPFVWRGLLPALGLLALLWFAFVPFARQGIENSVAREVRSTLDREGMGWVDVAVNGQQVLLAGMPPDPDAAEQALETARRTSCPTWAGNWTCPTTVEGQFDDMALALPSPPPATAPAARAVPARPVVPAAPAAATTPTPTPAAPPSAQHQAAAKACEKSLASLLNESQIQFESATATIDRSNRPLLDRLAAAAKACPGVVRVQGHTDSKGTATDNQQLSEARAAAVRDALLARGLSPNKVVAEGFGETRPLARNSTRAGRAANRRIEIRAD